MRKSRLIEWIYILLSSFTFEGYVSLLLSLRKGASGNQNLQILFPILMLQRIIRMLCLEEKYFYSPWPIETLPQPARPYPKRRVYPSTGGPFVPALDVFCEFPLKSFRNHKYACEGKILYLPKWHQGTYPRCPHLNKFRQHSPKDMSAWKFGNRYGTDVRRRRPASVCMANRRVTKSRQYREVANGKRALSFIPQNLESTAGISWHQQRRFVPFDKKDS